MFTDVSEVLAASIIKVISIYQTARHNIPKDSHLLYANGFAVKI
jgi:hypothetical protein